MRAHTAMALAALLLTSATRPGPPRTAAPPPVRLTSSSIALPEDAPTYPAGPHSELLDAVCSACHSPSMVLTQPQLTREQWQAEVKKMREVYRAQVPDEAVAGIVDYLMAMRARPAS